MLGSEVVVREHGCEPPARVVVEVRVERGLGARTLDGLEQRPDPGAELVPACPSVLPQRRDGFELDRDVARIDRMERAHGSTELLGPCAVDAVARATREPGIARGDRLARDPRERRDRDR